MNGLYFPLCSYRIKVNVFFPACIILMAASEGFLPFCCIFSAALIHEAGHCFFIYLFSQKITLFTVEPFGGMINYTTHGLTYKEERLISAGGMAANALTAFSGALLFCLVKSEYVLLFVFSSVFYIFINLLPLRSNDGGRIAYLLICEKAGTEEADKAIKAISVFGGALLLALGTAILYISDFNNGLCIIFLLAALPR